MSARLLLSRRTVLASSVAFGLAAPSIAQARLPDVTGVLRTNWSRDPLSLGSYSHLGLSARSEDRVALSTPIADRLFLAGEATHPDYPSTVHGALLSGRRAGDQAIRAGAGRVAIVGAGVAGLAAAQALSAAGRDVVLIEVRDRIGGRIETDRSLGVAVDLGAAWIHGARGNPVTGIARAAGLRLHPHDYDRVVVRTSAGRRLSSLPAALEDVVFIEQEFAEDLGALSDAALDEGEEFGGSDMLFPDGYDGVVSALADGAAPMLGVRVTRVAVTRNGVRLETDTGPVEADAAIVTVPLGCLQDGQIAFDPGLPGPVRGALDRLRMGVLDKLVLRFAEPFWEDDAEAIAFADQKDGRFAGFVNLMPVTGQPILVALNAGSAARTLSGRATDDLVQEATAVLTSMYS